MIEANNSQYNQQHSAWPFSRPKCMDTSVEQRQPGYFPASLNPSTIMISARSPVCRFRDVGPNKNGHMLIPNIVMPDYAWPVADTSGWKMEQCFEYQSFTKKSFPSFIPVFPPTTDVYHRRKPTTLLHGDNGEAVKGTPLPKTFLILENSGSRTELISHAMCPLARYPCAVSGLNLIEKPPFKESLFAVKQPSINENLHEKQTVEESMTHEDTEELNALLYSDEVDDDSSDGSNDDIISTDHSPSTAQGNREKAEQFEEIIEEVASSDHQNKQQNQLKVRCLKAPLEGACGSVNFKCSRKLDTDSDSHTSRAVRTEEMTNMSGKKRRENDNIHEMIRVLESIVPGAKGKDPLLVLDESIRYLKSLKVEAKCLGFCPL